MKFSSRPLLLIFVLSLAAYLLAPIWFPLGPYAGQHPLPDIRTFTPSLAAGLLYGLWFLLLYGLYGLAALRLRRLPQLPGLAWLLGTAFFLGIPQLFAFPINATDLYRYFIRGRIFSVYGQNPYVVEAASLTGDPFWRFAGEWATATSPYGPLWELTAGGVTGLVAQGGDNLLWGLLAFKLLGLLTHLANGALIWHILAGVTPQRQATMTLLWLWNPALFNIFVIDGHNDGLMLFWLLLGYLVWQRRQQPAPSWSMWPLPAFLLMVLAPLTKPIALLALPFFFIGMWHTIPAKPFLLRLRFALACLAGSLLLLWLAFWPFGSPFDLATRLLDEAAGGGFSPLTLLYLLLIQVMDGVPVNWLLNGARLLFVGAGLLWLWWGFADKRPSIRGAADIFTAYLWHAFSFRLWYAAWAFPWLLLDDRSYWRRVGFWFLLTTQLSVLIYGHLRFYALGGSLVWSHLIGVSFTFGLPL
ncbi:MAG: hypothetical protein R6X32_20460, partial [Chloroflexota bacterium]